jgi:hypothetical protein
VVHFWTFFALFVPAAVNFAVPAAIMHFAVPKEKLAASGDRAVMLRGARRIIFLFLATIVTAVSFHNFLNMPPVIGMLIGLGYLQLLGFYLKRTVYRDHHGRPDNQERDSQIGTPMAFDVFSPVAKAAWDTLRSFGVWGSARRSGPACPRFVCHLHWSVRSPVFPGRHSYPFNRYSNLCGRSSTSTRTETRLAS